MAALEVALSLPLDPLLSSSHWAWLIALFVATIATFSRLSLLTFLVDSKPLGKLLPSCLVKPQEQASLQQEMPSSEAEQVVAKKLYEARQSAEREEERNEDSLCKVMHRTAGVACLEEYTTKEQEEDAEEEDRPSLCGRRGRSRRVGEDNEQNRGSCRRRRTGEEEIRGRGDNIPSLWVHSLLEASRASSSAPPACAFEAHTVCTPFTFTPRSWSQALDARICARAGQSWDILEASLPSHIDPTPNLRNWPCPQSHISAIKVDTEDHGFAHVGFCSGELWLWDVESATCANRTSSWENPVSALGMFPGCNNPRMAIAAGPHFINKRSCVVNFWDDRSVSCNAEYTVVTPAGKAAALTCRAYEIGIAGEGLVSMHDARMVRPEPFCIYTSSCASKVGVGGHRSKSEGSICYFECEVEHSHKAGQETEECAFVDRTASSSRDIARSEHTYNAHLQNTYAGCTKDNRRWSFLTNCLAFMCLFDKKPHHYK